VGLSVPHHTAKAARVRGPHELAIPNEEVRHAFKASVRSWLESGLHGSGSVHELWKAMLDGNDELFQELLSTLVVRTFSFHDTVRQELERVYPV